MLSFVVIFLHSGVECIGTSEWIILIFFPALDCLVGVVSVAETNFPVLVFGEGAGRYTDVLGR